MNRKLIRQGLGGYTIYLPKKWIDEKGLKPGEEVRLESVGTALVITTSRRQRKSATIKITSENKEDIRHILTHLYRNGYDSMTIRDCDESAKAIVAKATRDVLLGFDVVDREGKKIRIENISEPSEEKFDVLLRRAFLLVKETFDMIFPELKNGKYPSVSMVTGLRIQMDKYLFFLRRVIIKETYIIRQPEVLWELLSCLRNVQHALSNLQGYAAKHKVKPSGRVLELYLRLLEYYQLIYDAYFKKDIALIHKVNQLKKEYQFDKCYRYIAASTGDEAVLLAGLRELFRLVQVISSPVLSTILDKEFKDSLDLG